MRLIQVVVMCLAATMFIVCGLWLKSPKNTVVCFDIQKIQGQFIRQLAAHNASETQVTRSTLQFKSLLQKTLQNYSQKNKIIVLDSKFHLAGGIDVTEAIANELAFAMSKSS
ncbi:TrbI F-type domain-containing protein [Legionella quateirensis]|uniref:F pilus extension/retraction protein TrbI Inner membrane protein n=1 Tax=Legionella quateirensis TaxID=45072 RepID=A0A378KTG4_9GAMM|nr:TrbI F-type domain-containing protein [Legionella quateirensis]KTD47795.1 F pilus extension/retraction protein TrbI Inner membrane protein [Legionella quateirensis]STY16688.1 F pilus extension/retraction protein TrbI Inner membrane protein [Legionella quateirensis]